jgi:hypothetical protein
MIYTKHILHQIFVLFRESIRWNLHFLIGRKIRFKKKPFRRCKQYFALYIYRSKHYTYDTLMGYHFLAKQPVAVVKGEFSGDCTRNLHTYLHLNDGSTTPRVYDKTNHWSAECPTLFASGYSNLIINSAMWSATLGSSWLCHKDNNCQTQFFLSH